MYKAKVRHSDIPFSGFVRWLVRDLYTGIKDISVLTTRGESHNAARADDVPRPIALRGQLEQIVLLCVIEVEALVLIARQAFMSRDHGRAEMKAVMLQSRYLSACISCLPSFFLLSSRSGITYLCASLQADTLQGIRRYGINGSQEVVEKWYIHVFQLVEIVCMHVGCIVGVGDALAALSYLPDDRVDGSEEVDRNVFDAGVLPEVLQRTSGRHHDARPR